jgi:hypothetical protein
MVVRGKARSLTARPLAVKGRAKGKSSGESCHQVAFRRIATIEEVAFCQQDLKSRVRSSDAGAQSRRDCSEQEILRTFA